MSHSTGAELVRKNKYGFKDALNKVHIVKHAGKYGGYIYLPRDFSGLQVVVSIVDKDWLELDEVMIIKARPVKCNGRVKSAKLYFQKRWIGKRVMLNI